MTHNKINTPTRLIQFVSTSVSSAQTSSAVWTSMTAVPPQTEGTELMTLSITPTSASSTLVIKYHSTLAGNVSGRRGIVALFQDSTTNAIAATCIKTTQIQSCTFEKVMTSGTTSATTFKIRFGVQTAGSFYINADITGARLMGGVSYAWLTIEEYL